MCILMKQVGQMVHALKMGWMKPNSEKKEEDDEPKYYQLWKDDEEVSRKHINLQSFQSRNL